MKPDIRIDVFKAAYYDQKDTLEPEKDTQPFFPVNSAEKSVDGKKRWYK
jgi:hypothetical protein